MDVSTQPPQKDIFPQFITQEEIFVSTETTFYFRFVLSDL